jgi:hypothetical protein
MFGHWRLFILFTVIAVVILIAIYRALQGLGRRLRDGWPAWRRKVLIVAIPAASVIGVWSVSQFRAGYHAKTPNPTSPPVTARQAPQNESAIPSRQSPPKSQEPATTAGSRPEQGSIVGSAPASSGSAAAGSATGSAVGSAPESPLGTGSGGLLGGVGGAGSGGVLGSVGGAGPIVVPSIPKFPWPPPAASARLVVPIHPFIPSTLGDFSDYLNDVLSATGYAELSYYTVPNGIAVVTRLEHIYPDGRPFADPDRWLVTDTNIRRFSLSNYIQRLFAVDQGFYRVVVFVVTDQAFSLSDKSLTAAEAVIWQNQGAQKLPRYLASLPFTPDDTCTALIYEFERDHEQTPRLLMPSPMAARDHLIASGLLPALSNPYSRRK